MLRQEHLRTLHISPLSSSTTLGKSFRQWHTPIWSSIVAQCWNFNLCQRETLGLLQVECWRGFWPSEPWICWLDNVLLEPFTVVPVEVVELLVIWFGHPLLRCKYLSAFEWWAVPLCQNSWNFGLCNSRLFWCLDSFTLLIKAWHSLKEHISKALHNSSIHISCCSPVSSVVLSSVLIYTCINCISVFLILSKLLSVLMVFLNFKLTWVMPFPKQLNVNFIWFSKSMIFLTVCSQFCNNNTFSSPNSFSIYICKFFILFICICKKNKSLKVM